MPASAIGSSGVHPDAGPPGPLGPPGPPGPPGPAPRRWPRRLLLGTCVLVAVCLVAGASAFGYVRWRFGQISRVSIPGLAPSPASGAPETILVVGSDSRANVKGADVKAFGSAAQTPGQRSDTIMVVHLDPRAGTASLLSVPRDLWVPIAGKGYSQRINVAFDTGPALLVQTVEASLGIEVNHYAEVDFNSFRRIVNSLGGVRYWYPEPVRDTFSGLNITTPGCYGLSGDMALSLVRSRHLQYYSGGRWHDEAESDLARIRRQQSFVKKVVHKAQGSGLTSLGALNGVVGGLVSNLTVDSQFSQSQMLALARRYRGFTPDRLTTATLPVTSAVVGGADVLLLDKAAAAPVIDALIGRPSTAPTAPTTTTDAPVDPSAVRVQVVNATGRTGEAARATAALRSAGFGTGAPTTSTTRAARSALRYPPGAAAAAHMLQARVGGGAELVATASLGPADLVLVLGTGFTGVTSGAPAGPGAAPSSAPSLSAPAGAGPVGAAPGAGPPSLGAGGPAPFPGPHGADPPPAGSGC